MIPLRRVLHATTDFAPQSHRHSHIPPDRFLPTRFIAVSLPKRWPAMSIKCKQPQLLVWPLLRQSPPTSHSRPQSQMHNQRILPSFLRPRALRATSRPKRWPATSIIANCPPRTPYVCHPQKYVGITVSGEGHESHLRRLNRSAGAVLGRPSGGMSDSSSGKRTWAERMKPIEKAWRYGQPADRTRQRVRARDR